jgi:hypothetical protein
MELSGNERLYAMNRRISREMQLAMKTYTNYITNSSPVVYISDKYDSMIDVYRQYRDMDREELMKKQWPESLRK